MAPKKRSSLDKLNLKQRVFVASRANGDTIKVASQAASISASSGRKLDKNSDVQAAYRELVREAIPASDLAELIRGGAHATMPVEGAIGETIGQQPDWKTRKPYIQMAAEHAGYFERKSENNATMISVTVNHIGQKDEAEQSFIEGETVGPVQ